jgi:hypothetical protein
MYDCKSADQSTVKLLRCEVRHGTVRVGSTILDLLFGPSASEILREMFLELERIDVSTRA